MNYLNKCVSKEDLLLRKLKASPNLIVFIINKNLYLAYTISDLKKLIANKQNHYIEGSDKLESFVELSIKIVVDSSLQKTIENKHNTLKLIETGKFRIGFEGNKQVLSYYSVLPVSRKEIESDEQSVFEDDKKEKEEKEEKDSDSEVEIDWTEVKKQERIRKQARLKILERQLKREQREMKQNEKRLEKLKREGNWVEEIKYDFEVKCVRYFENFILREEKWTKNGDRHREDDLPAIISYHENGNKKEEEWYKNGDRHREDDLPAWIKYREQKDCKQIENWYYNGLNQRGNDSPICIFYGMNGKIQTEYWSSIDKNRIDNHFPWIISYHKTGSILDSTWKLPEYVGSYPTYIVYYENGNIKSEHWRCSTEGTCFEIFYNISGLKSKDCRYQGGFLFKRTRYDDFGLKADETWYDKNGIVHRDGDEPAYINYFYKVSKIELIREIRWYIHGKYHRSDNPAQITFNENGLIKTEKWFQNDVCTKTMFHDDLIYTNDFVSTGDGLSLDF